LNLRPLWIAGRFLTRFPFPDPGRVEPQELGLALPWYPAIGALVGLALAGAGWLLAGTPPGVAAALILGLWVLSTGGLHLDGLADTADAWVGGLGSRERTLAIMKDPASGPAGVAALVLVLIAKYAALEALLPVGAWPSLVWVPLLARTTLPLLFVSTSYVRPDGMGAEQARTAPPARCRVAAAISAGACWLGLGWLGLGLVLAVALLYGLLRHAFIGRLGGFTGDTAGALTELAETLVLLLLALALAAPPSG
jgi:adenosylcobinamide-GDP ribazoletransferase